MPTARLCSACYQSIHSAAERTANWKRAYVRVEHQQSLSNLTVSADHGCPICGWILHQKLPGYRDQSLHSIAPETISSRLETLQTYHQPGRAHDMIPEFKVHDEEGGVLVALKINAVPISDAEADVTEDIGRIDRAAQWLNTCLHSHQACNSGRSNDDSGWRPSRLLYLRSLDGTLLMRLAEAVLDEYEPGVTYTALSHRWLSNELTLNADNISDFRKHIPVHLLKPAIRDAARISLELGVRYIWVDTLCIMQDSRGDKDLEISRMELVYGACCCNIAARATLDEIERHRDNDYGMSSSSYNVPLDMDRWIEGASTTWKLRLDWDDKELKESVLSSRAWVYQERYLSPRILSLCKDQVYWECGQLIASETFPEGKEQPFTAFTFGLTQNPAEQQPLATFNDWHSVVWDYTRGGLTFDEDKLRALAGVARLFEKTFNFVYLFGIWKESLPHSLLWEVLIRSRPGRRLKGIAPSWSWASVVGKIGIAWLTRGNPDAVPAVSYLPTLDSSVELSSSDIPNENASPLLHLHGRPWKARISAAYDHSLRGLDNCGCLQPRKGDESSSSWQEAILSTTLDCEETLPMNVVCLPIMARSPTYFSDGLILAAVYDDSSPLVYRRVGIYQGRKVARDPLQGLARQDLVIC